MEVYYCESWFRGKKVAVNIWNATKAHTAYINQQLYTVLLGSLKTPRCFIESTGDAIGIGFLDNLLREHMSYEFQEKKHGTTFLSMATERKFKEDTDEVIWGITYYYDEDGHVSIEEEDFVTNTLTSAETYLDVSSNWEPYPEFGEYESIARKDRVDLIPISDKKQNLFEHRRT